MRSIVVAASAEHEGMAREMLPHTPRTARGADRIYFFYRAFDETDYCFNDLDGTPLVEIHSFPTRSEADAWVVENTRQRHAFLSAGGRAQ